MASRFSSGPIFVPVGLSELNIVFKNLRDADPTLVNHLWGLKGVFTYDTPKFVESVLILSRGQTPHLASNPVLRFDEDVVPNQDSIRALLDAFVERSARRGYYFFSGCYGSPASNAALYDPVNDHAVRTHWCAPDGTLAGDRYQRNRNGQAVPRDKVTAALDHCRTFLADISQLGAPQEWPLTDDMSVGVTPRPLASAYGRTLVSSGMKDAMSRGLLGRDWRTQQVISGAGLIMSRRATALLPPFTGFAKLTMWVDDYVKRVLHEALGDIQHEDCASVVSARFHQNRHPNGTQANAVKDGEYFERVLRGCMLCRVVAPPPKEQDPTNFVKAVKATALFTPANIDRASLKEQIKRDALERGKAVLQAWQSPDYANTSLKQWADEQEATSGYLDSIAQGLARDCLRYLEFLANWPAYLRAVDRVPFIGESWLFAT